MRTNPYPVPRSRLWQTGSVTVYAMLAASGLVVAAYCLLHDPITFAGRMILWIWAAGTFFPGVICALAVALDRYRWEWVATWPLSTGVGVYAVSVWLGVQSVWDLANCFIITAFALTILGRGIHLGIVDRSARRELLRSVVRGVTDE